MFSQENIFGDDALKGEINPGLTPEKMARLGCAAAEVIGDKIAVSYDGGGGTQMVKNAVIAGILSGGANALDFGEQPLAISRSGIRFYNLHGGFHISDGGKKVEILGCNGVRPEAEVLELIVEKYRQNNMKRAANSAIKEVVSLHSYKFFYIRDLLNNCNNEQMNFTLLLCVENSTVKNILTGILKDTGCRYTLYKGGCRDDIRGFASVVKSEKYDFGVIIGDGGLTLCDGLGRVVSEEMFCCLCATIVFDTDRSKTYIAPVNAPSGVEAIAKNMGGKIIRTEYPDTAVMSKVSEMHNGRPGTQFVLSFDPVGSIVKIMDYLKSEKLTLAEATDDVPEFFIKKKKLPCEKEAAEKLVNKLTKFKGIGHERSGVKVYEEGGWAYLDCSLKNAVSIVCEGATAEMAEEIMDKYTEMVTGMATEPATEMATESE